VLKEIFSSKWLDVDEPALKFKEEVKIEGHVSIVNEYLVIQLDIQAEALLPCSICNEWVTAPIQLKKFYHTEELSHIQRETFDFSVPLREAILLEVPTLVECKGKCPEREHLKKYFKTDQGKIAGSEDLTRFPFAHL
ncbi:MAG: hypothetical protein HYZ47_02750, partial [Simkania negevensis]|nr:hypothetical protein [Simkania negevensis]